MLPHYLYKVQPCFLINSTILSRKYKEQCSNFTILNSSSNLCNVQSTLHNSKTSGI